MMDIDEMLSSWRSMYAEWISADLQLREARHRGGSERILSILEQKVRSLQLQCSECQDEVSAALSRQDEPENV